VQSPSSDWSVRQHSGKEGNRCVKSVKRTHSEKKTSVKSMISVGRCTEGRRRTVGSRRTPWRMRRRGQTGPPDKCPGSPGLFPMPAATAAASGRCDPANRDRLAQGSTGVVTAEDAAGAAAEPAGRSKIGSAKLDVDQIARPAPGGPLTVQAAAIVPRTGSVERSKEKHGRRRRAGRIKTGVSRPRPADGVVKTPTLTTMRPDGNPISADSTPTSPRWLVVFLATWRKPGSVIILGDCRVGRLYYNRGGGHGGW